MTIDGKPISELLAKKEEREKRKAEQLVMTVPEAGAKLGLSREASFISSRPARRHSHDQDRQIEKGAGRAVRAAAQW
jgi:hypothetical protein